jgi:hypothetical protein
MNESNNWLCMFSTFPCQMKGKNLDAKIWMCHNFALYVHSLSCQIRWRDCEFLCIFVLLSIVPMQSMQNLLSLYWSPRCHLWCMSSMLINITGTYLTPYLNISLLCTKNGLYPLFPQCGIRLLESQRVTPSRALKEHTELMIISWHHALMNIWLLILMNIWLMTETLNFTKIFF